MVPCLNPRQVWDVPGLFFSIPHSKRNKSEISLTISALSQLLLATSSFPLGSHHSPSLPRPEASVSPAQHRQRPTDSSVQVSSIPLLLPSSAVIILVTTCPLSSASPQNPTLPPTKVLSTQPPAAQETAGPPLHRPVPRLLPSKGLCTKLEPN